MERCWALHSRSQEPHIVETMSVADWSLLRKHPKTRNLNSFPPTVCLWWPHWQRLTLCQSSKTEYSKGADWCSWSQQNDEEELRDNILIIILTDCHIHSELFFLSIPTTYWLLQISAFYDLLHSLLFFPLCWDSNPELCMLGKSSTTELYPSPRASLVKA